MILFNISTDSTEYILQSAREAGRFPAVLQHTHPVGYRGTLLPQWLSKHTELSFLVLGIIQNFWNMTYGQPNKPINSNSSVYLKTFTKRVLRVQYPKKTTATPKCIKKPLCHFMVSGYNR